MTSLSMGVTFFFTLVRLDEVDGLAATTAARSKFDACVHRTHAGRMTRPSPPTDDFGRGSPRRSVRDHGEVADLVHVVSSMNLRQKYARAKQAGHGMTHDVSLDLSAVPKPRRSLVITAISLSAGGRQSRAVA